MSFSRSLITLRIPQVQKALLSGDVIDSADMRENDLLAAERLVLCFVRTYTSLRESWHIDDRLVGVFAGQFSH